MYDTSYFVSALSGSGSGDSSSAPQQPQVALADEAFFEQEIKRAMALADAPNAKWYTAAEAQADWQAQKAQFLAK